MSDSKSPPSPYSRIMTKAFDEAIPLYALFEITYRCNHLCAYCYNAPTGQKEMTTPQIFEALRKIADFGVLYVTLTGGEPLCHKDFFDIAAEVRRLGMALRIYTNGYLLSDKAKVKRVRALSPTEVEISVHGARAETHEALTKINGSFDRTLEGIRNLREVGIKVNLKCAITRLNQEEILDTKALADDLGCHIVFDPVITPKDDGNLDPLSLRADEEFFRRYWSEIYPKVHGGKLPPLSKQCSAEGSKAACGTGRSGFTLDPYGNILPCVTLRRKVANIVEIESLAEVWDTSPVLLEVRDLAVRAGDLLRENSVGRFASFCMGVAETQTGDPLAMYPQAEVNARAVESAYDLLQIEDLSGRKSA